MIKMYKYLASMMAVVFLSGTCVMEARRLPRRSHRLPRVIVRTVPPATAVSHSYIGQEKRLAVAMSYLEANGYLTLNRYAKITGLSKNAARTELEVFVSDRNIPIKAIVICEKRVYVKAS